MSNNASGSTLVSLVQAWREQGSRGDGDAEAKKNDSSDLHDGDDAARVDLSLLDSQRYVWLLYSWNDTRLSHLAAAIGDSSRCRVQSDSYVEESDSKDTHDSAHEEGYAPFIAVHVEGIEVGPNGTHE